MPLATYRRILVPLDGSNASLAAIPWVRALATDETHLTLLRSVPIPLPMGEVAVTYYEAIEEIHQYERDAAHDWLEAIADTLRDVTGNITCLTGSGVAADEILGVAEEREVDLIVMATHGRGAAGRFAIGSVADRVARAARVPVFLARRPEGELEPDLGARARPARLVIPHDGSARAASAVPVARELAQLLETPVHLVRVLPEIETFFARRTDASGFTPPRTLAPLLTAPLSHRQEQYYTDFRAAAEEALRSEVQKLGAGGVEASCEVLAGETIPTLEAELSPDDVVVMTSHGAGGVRRWLLGSVAEQLVRSGKTPVVLVPNRDRETAPSA